MAGLENKASRLGNGNSARIEDVGIDVSHGTALLAQQVEIGVVGEVVNGSPVAEMNMVDNAELGECVEGSVDGRPVNGGVSCADLCGQVVGGGVVSAGHECLDHGPSGFGESAASAAEPCQNVVEGLTGHIRNATRLRFLTE